MEKTLTKKEFYIARAIILAHSHEYKEKYAEKLLRIANKLEFLALICEVKA